MRKKASSKPSSATEGQKRTSRVPNEGNGLLLGQVASTVPLHASFFCLFICFWLFDIAQEI